MVNRYLIILVFFYLSAFASVSIGYIKVSPYIAATQEYDDNILYNNNEEELIDDAVTTFSFEADIRNRSERIDVSAAAGFAWKEYWENTELGGLDQSFDASASSRLTEKFSLSLATDYSKDSRRDRDFEESGLVDESNRPVTEQVLERVVRTRQNTELSTDYVLSEITTTSLSYEYSQSDYDDPEFADYFSHNAGIGVERDISTILPEARVNIGVHYLRYESELSEFETNEQTDRIIDSVSAMAGINGRLTERIQVSAQLGARLTDTSITIRNETGVLIKEFYSEWGTIGELKYRYEKEYTNYNLSLTHDITPRSSTGGTVNNTASVISMNHRLTEKIRVGLEAGYYLNRSDASLSSEEIDEHAMRIRPDLRYIISEYVFLEGFYSFRSVMDEVSNTETERNLVMILVSIGYP